jgi:hypothetical protein
MDAIVKFLFYYIFSLVSVTSTVKAGHSVENRVQCDHVEYNTLKTRKFEKTQISQKQRPVARKMIKYRTEKN